MPTITYPNLPATQPITAEVVELFRRFGAAGVLSIQPDPAPLPAAAAGADTGGALVVAPFDGLITDLEVTPSSAIAGVDVDSRTIQVRNRGRNSSNPAPVVVASKAFTGGVAADAGEPSPVPVTGPATVRAGDVLEFQSLHVGAGLAAPDFQCSATFGAAI